VKRLGQVVGGARAADPTGRSLSWFSELTKTTGVSLVPGIKPDAAAALRSRCAGHHDVEEEHVGRSSTTRSSSMLAISVGDHLVAGGLENALDHLQFRHHVIHHHDLAQELILPS